MEIYLLRHGIAEDARPGEPDSDRALTATGRQKLRRVLSRARDAGLQPSVILSSPYRRALETTGVAVECLGYKGKVLQTTALVPDADPHESWEEIRVHKSEDALLLSSHEPLMSSLLAFLLNCPSLLVDFKKAALVRVDCDRFGPQPHCILKWMLTAATAGDQ
jgi:phosphohistidine phosphatase